LLKKDPHALRATKWAVRRMTEMTYDNAEDYLIRAQEALHSFGGVAARKEATRQFLDEKSFKPGLGTFDTSKVKG
jgi:feruloyl-CoA hydratase/lyase